MITLVDVSRRIGQGRQSRNILLPTSHVFGPKERVGILADRGSGKSIIARLLAGIEQPDEGHVLRLGRVSWPVGHAGMLHPDVTVAENIQLIADILGEDPLELTAICLRVTGLESMLDAPTKSISPAGRSGLAFCLSLAIACETYIVDEATGFGTGAQRDLSEAMFLRRMSDAGAIILASNPRTIGRFCTRVIALVDARLVPCPDVETAAAVLEAGRTRSDPGT